ncbi:MAG: MFS transporter [Burkholderiales bacterium]
MARRSGPRGPRSFAWLVALGVLNHSVLAGLRVDVSLDALARGGSPATVGVLMALFALLPAILSVSIGRLCDRTGVRSLLILSSAALAIATALPALLPGFVALALTAAATGLAFGVFQIAAQHATAQMGDPVDRVRRYTLLALGYSVSGMAGPLVAGFGIDHAGHRATFALLAVIPLVPLAVLTSGRIALPAPAPHVDEGSARGYFDLWRDPSMRRVLVLNALFAIGWDLNTIFVPIYGAQIGLAAAEIGLVLAVFNAATFTVRLAMPWIAARQTETRVIGTALLVSAAAFFAFPFAPGVVGMSAVAYTLGLGLGAGQPMVLSLLASRAPPGRLGEAAGMRMTMIQSMAVGVPLAFGALGAAIGLAPVLWAVGAGLAAGGALARRGA